MHVDKMTKKQHFVPQFYLNYFTDKNGQLHVFDRAKKRSFCTYPKDFLYIKMQYETKWEGASKQLGDYVLPNELEHSLSKSENRFSQLTIKLVERSEGIEKSQSLILDKDEKDCLAEYVSNLYLRNPSIFADIQAEYADSTGLDICKSVESLFSALTLGSSDSIVKHSIKQGILDPTIPGSPAYVEKASLLKMNLSFALAHSKDFITSSCPVITIGVRESALTERIITETVLFPITPKLLAIYSINPGLNGSPNKLYYFDDETTQNVNNIYDLINIDQARYLIAKKKESLEPLWN